MTFGLVASTLTFAAPAPTRVGPVSQYGKLIAGKNSAGEGRIYGSCLGAKDGAEVQVRGMSLGWMTNIASETFFNAQAVEIMIDRLGIEVLRVPVAFDAEGSMNDWWSNKDHIRSTLKEIVDAATKKDIYVIIDWHSHTAHLETNPNGNPQDFFFEMAQTYSSYTNVIFEIYNEPACSFSSNTDGADKETGAYCDDEHMTTWQSIASYANRIIPQIRKNSDNLIIVGTPFFDQKLSLVGDDVMDSKHNIAYALHYYASQEQHTVASLGNGQAEVLMGKGYPVFVSEWGTCEASGNGEINTTRNTQWQTWLDNNQVSSVNWSATLANESCAAFNRYDPSITGGIGPLGLTTSGEWVKTNVFSKIPKSYTKCEDLQSSGGDVGNDPVLEGIKGVAIDDFEDGDGVAKTGGADAWYTYADEASSYKHGDVVSASYAYSSKAGAGITNVKMGNSDSYAAIGIDIHDGLAGCNVIKYKYKGAAHDFKAMMKNGPVAGHFLPVNESAVWTTATAIFQPEEDNIEEMLHMFSGELDSKMTNKLAWQINSNSTLDYLYIDDVECDALDPNRSLLDDPEDGKWIDNFEDGDIFALLGSKEDVWYWYHNVDGSVSMHLVDAGLEMAPQLVLKDFAKESSFGAGFEGINMSETPDVEHSVTLGLGIKTGLPSTCKAIRYDYKGATHYLKAAMKGDEEGALTGYQRNQKQVAGSASWKSVTVKVSDMKQPGSWAKPLTLDIAQVYELAWNVNVMNKSDLDYDYLFIDNVVCVENLNYVSSSSSSKPASSSSATGVVVEDFEDGNTTPEALSKSAYWYAYNANGATISNKEKEATDGDYKYWDIVRGDASNKYASLENIDLGEEDYPSVGMGIGGFKATEIGKCTKGIAYKYKGANHTFRATPSNVEKDAGYDFVKDIEKKATSWTTVTVNWSDLAQPSWIATSDDSDVKKNAVKWDLSKVIEIAWVVNDPAAGNTLSIDDVTCLGAVASSSSSKPASSSSVSSSSSKPASSSSDVSSSSEVNESSSSTTVIAANVVQSGLKAFVEGSVLNIVVAKSGVVKVSVFDMMGNIVESHAENLSAGAYAHPIAGLANGTYVVRVQQGSAMKMIRLQVR